MPKYAQFNPAANPSPVLNWWDTDNYTWPNLPGKDYLLQITEAQWAARTSGSWQVQNRQLVAVPAQTLANARTKQIALVSAGCNGALLGGFDSSALGSAYTYPSKPLDQTNIINANISARGAKGSGQWQASVAVTQRTTTAEGSITFDPQTKQAYVCSTSGTTGATEPTWPSVINTPVTDNTAAWVIWTTPMWCATGGVWNFIDHTADQVIQVGMDYRNFIAQNLLRNKSLQDQINAAATIQAVQAIVW